MPRLMLLALLLAAALAATGCGRDVTLEDSQRPALLTPKRSDGSENLGFPVFATKNTTRVPGSDATAMAAAVARAVFPDPARRPDAVTLVDAGDWRVAIAAAALMAPPIGAPVLLTDGEDMPAASQRALDALRPTGSEKAGKAQVIRVGDVPKPDGYKTTDLAAGNALGLTRAIAGLITTAKHRTATSVIVTTADDPAYAAPAAGYAAKSGTPVLFVGRRTVPPETRAALAAMVRPRIYVLAPSRLVSPKVTRELRRIGRVKRVGGKDPVTNAIALARYHDGSFGWGISQPGHGLVFARSGRPLDAVAASPLSASGMYGPLLLVDSTDRLPQPLLGFLLDIQPGYRDDPVLGYYNHGWIIGDRDAITTAQQSRIDVYLEIVPERTPDAPPEPPSQP